MVMGIYNFLNLPRVQRNHLVQWALTSSLKATSTHLKGASICLMYDCPKTLSFIAAMGLKVHPHFYIVLINTLKYVFASLCPTTTYLSISQVCPF